MSNGKDENTEKMDSVEDPSNTLPTIVGEELIAEAENKLNEEAGEVVGNKTNKIRRKRGRPSEKDRDKEDKEDLPESKKDKKSPRKNITNKRGRPSGKDRDKEDLPDCKKVKKSPKKRINLKIMSINSNGKRTGFPRLYEKKNKEKCIFCQEEYLQVTHCEGVGQEKSNILQFSICGSCHACLKDDMVMKEIREIILKKQF